MCWAEGDEEPNDSYVAQLVGAPLNDACHAAACHGIAAAMGIAEPNKTEAVQSGVI